MNLYMSRWIGIVKPGCPLPVLLDRYQWHRSLCRAFALPELDDDAKAGAIEAARPLYDLRIEGGAVEMLVQARSAPDWRLLQDTRIDLADPPEVVLWTPESVPSGELPFRLAARASVHVGGKRKVAMDRGEQLAWLARREAEAGFRIVAASAEMDEFHELRRGQAPRRLLFVRFEGELVVEDPQIFAEAVGRGFGPGKAHGFGLLRLPGVQPLA